MDHTSETSSEGGAVAGAPLRMTVAEAARRIGVCQQTVRNYAHAGRLKWFWGNGTRRPSGLLASSVEAFVRSAEGRCREDA